MITLAITLISMGLKAQSTDKLVGEWEFSAVYNESKLDASTIKSIKELYEGAQMSFFDDGTYFFSNA